VREAKSSSPSESARFLDSNHLPVDELLRPAKSRGVGGAEATCPDHESRAVSKAANLCFRTRSFGLLVAPASHR
jgi:hypothetical protein